MTSRAARRWLFLAGLFVGLVLSVGWVNRGRLGGLMVQFFPSGGRQPTALVYLAPSAGPELWILALDGSPPLQLSHSGGKVYDFAPLPDGSRVLFSAGNAFGGLDLWQVDRSGANLIQILDCGADRCSEGVVSQDGRKIAYSRRTKAENPAGAGGIARIWVLDAASGATAALYADARIAGQTPSWSPNGEILSFYNPRAVAIQFHDMRTGEDFSAPTRREGVGGWAPDGSRMVFSDYLLDSEPVRAVLMQIDLRSHQIAPLTAGLDLADFGTPAFNPAGTLLAVSGPAGSSSAFRQIWLVDLRDGSAQPISTDPLWMQGGFAWEPNGEGLVYQQIGLAGETRLPSVWLWDPTAMQARQVARDAFAPAWLAGSD